MATLTRQPFAPLDGARLKSLTSLKNRQNAMHASPIKRKVAEVQDGDDFENVDPLSSKRSKGSKLDGDLTKTFFKPPTFVLTKAASTSSINSSMNPPPKPRSRSILQPKSPAARLNALSTQSCTPLTAPAGRSPPRGSKRIGILSRHRRHAQRIDPPPSFGLGSSAAPFSLDAALKGSIPAYSGSLSLPSSSSFFQTGSEMQSSWFFDIHEDTPEQEITNLLQHHTGTLDISSDEESERRVMRERAEGKDKENIPPPDDVSQTSSRMRVPDENEMMGIEKQRGPLAEMNARDYYAEGCDEDSVVIVPWDEDDEQQQGPRNQEAVDAHHQQEDRCPREPQPVMCGAETPVVSLAEVESVNVDEVMSSNAAPKPAAVLEPIEGTGESFELWESTSAKDEGDAPASPVPALELKVNVEDATLGAEDVVL
ncbi:hypothetical protein QBC42DRAFT_71997 [Cladorrhinum samala]|uniref:Thymidylate kinase n=1 Tax=Cladorrhinum samala TaxID=585594 RepID=A0AAV9HV86_9PEZI|nr:hypothetical protein QBC42DRAFT_71997 [Cladorrhinum samala]